MLDRKYTDAYNSVCAPENMLDKILTADKPVKKSFNYRKLALIAVCMLSAFLILPLYAGLTEPTVILNGMPTAVSARTVDTCLTITLDLDRKTEISVSDGTVSGIPSGKIEGEYELIWSFVSRTDQELTLSLNDIFGTSVYTLCYNENNDSWSIVKK